MKAIKTVADLAERANPDNPRQITPEKLEALAKSMAEFGDLSGLILNRTTGRMIGGHQRVKLLEGAKIVVERSYSKPTRTATVAEGYALKDGERFTYREVKWPADKERAAMIAANAHGGEWDDFRLEEILADLKAAGRDMETVGFDTAQLEVILKKSQTPSRGTAQPKQSDDDFTLFELVMKVENKKRLSKMLDRIRSVDKLDSLEPALMKLCDAYDEMNPTKKETK